jgi:CubicO group peptidase (beta-lactamase class C family)
MLALLLVAGFATLQPIHAQVKKQTLVSGNMVTATLKTGDKHQYLLPLKENEFALLRLEQKGVDAIITVYDPAGKKVEDFDSPNGKNGPEIITLTSAAKGAYSLEVRPLDENETGGSYDLRIVRIEPKGATPEKQVDQLFAAWNDPNVPGAAVSVMKDNKILLKKGYGSANLEYNEPITPSTVFHIASVSKQFTAFAILLLEQDGKLSLDDDIRKYIPEMPDFGKTITLRHLATHNSGLRDQWELLAMAGWRLDDVITKEHILKMVSRQRELNFNPGDEHLYCNTGFTLLAEVVARVSGKTFAEFTHDRIFVPLGMNHTLFYDDHEKIVKNRAYSFSQDGGDYKKSVLSYANVGATSLFTTVEDMCLWAMNFDNPKVGTPALIRKMNTRAVLNSGDSISYALGQDKGEYKGLKFICHGGADAGYRTFFIRIPEQHFAVTVFSNFANFSPDSKAFKIIDIYLKDKLAREPEKSVAPSTKDTVKTVLDEALLARYAGKYEVERGVYATISLENNKLFAEAPSLPKTQLVPVNDHEFNIPVMNAFASFVMENGKVTKLVVKMNGGEMTVPRIPDFDASSVILADFEGNYYSPELNTTYTFRSEKGKLHVTHQRVSDFDLTPVKPDVFNSTQWFFGLVEFVRDAAGKVSGCKVTTGRVRNLKFEKVN